MFWNTLTQNKTIQDSVNNILFGKKICEKRLFDLIVLKTAEPDYRRKQAKRGKQWQKIMEKKQSG